MMLSRAVTLTARSVPASALARGFATPAFNFSLAATLSRSTWGPQLIGPSCRYLSTATSTENKKETPKDKPKPANFEDGLEEEGEPFRFKDWFTPSGLKKQYKNRKQTLIAYAKIGGVVVGIYYVVKTGYNIADFMAATSFYDVATVSFAGGMVSSGIIAIILAYTSRMFTIRPENAYKQVLRKIQRDSKVQTALGGKVLPGKFRAYNISTGGPQILANAKEAQEDFVGWERFWKPRTVQMIFQLEGQNDKGMVSFEAQKQLDGSYQFNTITLDCMNSGDRLVIEGDENIEVYQGKIKLR